MFGNKTLYTTTKCRSMTTRNEINKIEQVLNELSLNLSVYLNAQDEIKITEKNGNFMRCYPIRVQFKFDNDFFEIIDRDKVMNYGYSTIKAITYYHGNEVYDIYMESDWEMTTKSEFEQQWNNCKEDVKKIRLTNGDAILATEYFTILSYVDLIGNDWHIGVFDFKNIEGIECEWEMNCPKCGIDVKGSFQYFYRCYKCHTVFYVMNEGTLKEYKLDKRVIRKWQQ